MGDISKNFSYSEYKPHGASYSWIPDSKYQKLLINNLTKDLQVVRSEMSSGCYMKITSAVRTLSDYHRLKNKGHNPSQTSDHFFGASIKLNKNSKKFSIFGDTYNFASGASDIVAVGMSNWDLFELTFNLVNSGACDFKQVIYEKNETTGVDWIHYGGSIYSLFSPEIVELLKKPKFMKSLDNGKSYSVVNSID